MPASGKGDKMSESELEQRRRAPLRHGGAAAIARLQSGEPFDGLALAELQGVLDTMGLDLDRLSGIDRLRVMRAARFEAATRLFDGAALAAAASGNLDKWENYQKRIGWLGRLSFNALGEIRALALSGDALDYERILAQQREETEND